MTTVLSELREMDDDELVTRLVEARQELFNFRFQHVTGQLDNYSRLAEVRKEIARIHTLLREREIAAAEAGEAATAAPTTRRRVAGRIRGPPGPGAGQPPGGGQAAKAETRPNQEVDDDSD